MALQFLNDGYFAGKVGIGVETPLTTLHLYDTGGSILRLASDNHSDNNKIEFDALNNGAIYHSIVSNTNTGNLQIRAGDGGSGHEVNIYTDGLFAATFDNNQRLGIGTPTPNAKLHTKTGSSNSQGYDSSVGLIVEGATRSIIQVNSTSDAYLMFGDAAQLNRAWFGYQHSNDQLVLHTGSTISMDGNVGIGTTSPNHKLDIYSNENVPLRIHRPNNANLDSAGAWGIGFSTRGDAVNSITDTRSGIFSYYNGNLFLATNNTRIDLDPDSYARLTILSTGSIKFNAYDSTNLTGTPTYMLGTDASGNVVKVLGGDIPGGGGTVTGTGATSQIPLWSDGPNGVLGNSIISQNGTSRISVASSSASLTLGQWDGSNNRIESASRPLFITSYTSPIKLGISGSTTMTIESSNVGIGTTAPIDKLNVNGGTGDTSTQQPKITVTRTSSTGNVLAGKMILTTKPNDTTNHGNLVFQVKTTASAGESSAYYTDAITIDGKNANVGIGTTSPSHKLEIGLTSSVALSSQPAIPLLVSNNGQSVDGRVFIQVKNDVVNTASAVGAGLQMTAAGVTSGTASYENSLIFLQSKQPGNQTIHSAPQNIQFYVDNDGTAAGAGASYAALGDLAFELQADGEAIFNYNVGIGTTSPGSKLVVAGGTDTAYNDGTLKVVGSIALNAANNLNPALNRWALRPRAAGVEGSFDIYDARNSLSRLTIVNSGNVGIGTTSPIYKLTVSGGIEAGGLVTYSKVAGSLSTTGYAVAGLTAGFNGASAGFEFKCYGSTGKYQRIVYSCYGDGTTWRPRKVIDEGTNDLDVSTSADGTTITFTFKARSSTQSYSPRVVVQATGHSINSTYA